MFIQVRRPSFETSAEIKILRKLGVDNVSMSLAVEVIVVRHVAKVSKNLFAIIKNFV